MGRAGVTTFDLPVARQATEPPEARGLRRDEVRLLVSHLDGRVEHRHFHELPQVLQAGDLLVVNTSGTLSASLQAERADGEGISVGVGGLAVFAEGGDEDVQRLGDVELVPAAHADVGEDDVDAARIDRAFDAQRVGGLRAEHHAAGAGVEEGFDVDGVVGVLAFAGGERLAARVAAEVNVYARLIEGGGLDAFDVDGERDADGK